VVNTIKRPITAVNNNKSNKRKGTKIWEIRSKSRPLWLWADPQRCCRLSSRPSL